MEEVATPLIFKGEQKRGGGSKCRRVLYKSPVASLPHWQYRSLVLTMWKEVVALLAAVVVISVAKEEKDDVGTVIGIDLGTTYSW